MAGAEVVEDMDGMEKVVDVVLEVAGVKSPVADDGRDMLACIVLCESDPVTGRLNFRLETLGPAPSPTSAVPVTPTASGHGLGPTGIGDEADDTPPALIGVDSDCCCCCCCS